MYTFLKNNVVLWVTKDGPDIYHNRRYLSDINLSFAGVETKKEKTNVYPGNISWNDQHSHRPFLFRLKITLICLFCFWKKPKYPSTEFLHRNTSFELIFRIRLWSSACIVTFERILQTAQSFMLSLYSQFFCMSGSVVPSCSRMTFVCDMLRFFYICLSLNWGRC